MSNPLSERQYFDNDFKTKVFTERFHIDLVLIFGISIIIVFSLFVLYSASNEDMGIVFRQMMYYFVGFISMILIAQISPKELLIWSKWFYLLGVCLLVGVLLFGIQSKGAQRWLQLPGIRIQPSEFIKLVMPIVVAGYLSNRSLPPSIKQILFVFLVVGLPVFLIAKQPDLGTSILIASSGLFVLLLSGLSLYWILGAVVFAIPSLYVLWEYVMYDYQKQRVITFINPESDPLGSGWNIIQSTVAIGSGGLYGKGWMAGTQSRLDFLPESHTDFIIAVLAEEFGFLGCAALLIMYAFVIGRGIYIALNADSLFGRLLAGGIVMTFFVYIFVNIGMVTGVLPVVGVPLPLVSRGGTSIVTLMLGFGILMSIHKRRTFFG